MTETDRTPDAALEDRCVDTIRFLAVDAVQKANSGHPGAPMALAPAAHVLFTRHLRYDPKDPAWPDRDRFVLSAGHASMLLYSMLHLTGYDLSLDDLKVFRQWGSRTPGHPEHGVVPGVETTTGPLGQGLGNAVGMAIAEAHLAAEFNDAEHQVVDHRTYVIAGDGDLMEGVASEAASLAGHLALGKLIVLYDDNHISIDGSDRPRLHRGPRQALRGLWLARAAGRRRQRPRGDRRRPDGGGGRDGEAVVHRRCARTSRFGSPNKQDTAGAHGAPLGADEVKLTKENLGWPLEPDFLVPDEVDAYYREAAARAAHGARGVARPRGGLEGRRSRPAPQRWDDAWARALPEGWDASLPVYPADAKGVADARRLGRGARRARAGGAGADRRLRRPDALEQHARRRHGRLPARLARRPLPALRRARARHGRRGQRARPARRPASVRRHVLRLHRLPASGDAPRRPHGAARRVPVHARQRRPRRGRTDASAGRAPCRAARDPGRDRPAAGRRQRDDGGLAGRAALPGRARGPDAHASESYRRSTARSTRRPTASPAAATCSRTRRMAARAQRTPPPTSSSSPAAARCSSRSPRTSDWSRTACARAS